ncbi:hypothetical protein NESM_000416300 [Novymonas esmeraldas]|uniref:HMG box domain-containing protein n=1 Tax=Novymonas esmeraldas TaxID=1808958 RepID=A0AAW0ELA3_9TRYP
MELVCGGCQCTLRYCPCCGAALPLRREGEARHGGGHDTLPSGTAACHAGADVVVTTPAAWRLDAAVWRQRLPRRPVSAYEVYLAVLGVAADAGETVGGGAAVRGITEDAFGEDLPPAAAAAVDAEHTREQQPPRDAALSWLRMAAAEKQAYAAEAQAWQDTLAAGGPAPPVEPHRQSRPPQTAPRSSTKRSAAGETRVRYPSSFDLFRAGLKGRRKMTMTEVCAVWRCMSAAEKAPYDVAAASQRTELRRHHALSR